MIGPDSETDSDDEPNPNLDIMKQRALEREREKERERERERTAEKLRQQQRRRPSDPDAPPGPAERRQAPTVDDDAESTATSRAGPEIPPRSLSRSNQPRQRANSNGAPKPTPNPNPNQQQQKQGQRPPQQQRPPRKSPTARQGKDDGDSDQEQLRRKLSEFLDTSRETGGDNSFGLSTRDRIPRNDSMPVSTISSQSPVPTLDRQTSKSTPTLATAKTPPTSSGERDVNDSESSDDTDDDSDAYETLPRKPTNPDVQRKNVYPMKPSNTGVSAKAATRKAPSVTEEGEADMASDLSAEVGRSKPMTPMQKSPSVVSPANSVRKARPADTLANNNSKGSSTPRASVDLTIAMLRATHADELAAMRAQHDNDLAALEIRAAQTAEQAAKQAAEVARTAATTDFNKRQRGLERDLAAARADAEEARTDTAKIKSDLARAKADLDRALTDLAAAQDDLETARDELAEAKAAAQAASRAAAGRRSADEEVEAELAQLRAQLDEATTRNEKEVRRAVKKAERALRAEYEARIEASELEFKAKLEASKQQAKVARKKADSDDENDETDRKMNALREKYEAKISQLESSHSTTVGKLEDEIEVLKSNLQRAESTLLTLKTQHFSERERLQESVDELEEQLRVLGSVKNTSNELASRVQLMDQAMEEGRQALVELEKEYQNVTIKLDKQKLRFERDLSAEKQESARIAKKLDSTQRKLTQTYDELEATKQIVSSMDQTAVKALQLEIERLQKSMAKAEREKLDMMQDLKYEKDNHASLEAELNSLRRQYEKCVKSIDNWDAERSRYESTIIRLRQDLEDTQVRFEEMRVDYVANESADNSTLQSVRAEFRSLISVFSLLRVSFEIDSSFLQQLRKEHREQLRTEIDVQTKLADSWRALSKEKEDDMLKRVDWGTQTNVGWLVGDEPLSRNV
ncbi:hypothetical protein HDU84_009013 [Entophlyctis sp. JEL0112]|nr:hypothetical protein HDU84_009013 [Entophlyctis sp. JEL0112]